MEIRQLKYFLSAAKHLSFTTAAQECYIVQSAMSQQIAALEKELGVTLFERGGRTMAFPLRELRYLESRNHGVVLHLKEEEQPLSISLAEAEQLVPAGVFRRCHKSYLVNLEWVGHIARTEVCLRDGERLPVSRTVYADFQSALIHYLNHPKA